MPPKLPAHLPPPPTGAKSKSVRTGGKAPPRNLPKTVPHRAAAKSEESPKEREPRAEPAPASPDGEAGALGRREVPSKAPATGPTRAHSRPPLPPHASPPKKLPPGQGNKAKHPPPAPAPPRVRSQSPAAETAADAEPKEASASATKPDQAAAARDGSSECSPPADDTPAQPAKPAKLERSPPSPQQQRSGKSRPKLPSSLPPRGGRPSSVASNDRVRAARITPPRPARRVAAVGKASEADEAAPAPARPAPASENIAERECTPTNDAESESEGSCDEAQSTRSVETAPVDVAQPPKSPEAGGSPPSHGSPGRNGRGSGSVAAPAQRPQVPVPTRDHRDNLHGRRRDRADDDDDDDGRGSRCSEEVAEGCAPRPAEPRHSRHPSTSAASPPQRRTATPEAQRRMRRGELDSSLHTTVASQPPTNTFVPAVHVDRRYVAASQLSTRTAQSEASGSRYTFEDDAQHHSDAAAPPSTRSSRARAPDDTRLHAEDAGYGAPRSQRGPSQRSQHSSRSLVPEWNASTNTRSLSARSGPRSTAPSELGSEAPQRPQPVELPPLFCISLVVLPPPPPSLVASSSQGKVRASWHSVARNFKVRVHGDLASELTVIQIKRAVASVTDFPLEKQRLLHNGVELAGLGPGEVVQDHFARLQEEGAPTDESTPGPHFFVMPRAESPHRASGNPIARLSAGYSADRNEEPLAPAMLDITEEGASPQASGSLAATPRRVPSAEARQSSLRTIQGPSPAAASYLVTPGSHTRPRLGGGGARVDVRTEADGREEADFIDSYASDAPLERRLLLDSPRAGNKQAAGRQEGGRHGSRQIRGSTSVAHPAPVSPVRADGSPRLRPGAAATRADSEASSVSFRSVTQSTAAGRGQSRASAYTRMSVEAPKRGASVHTDPLADAFVGAVERRMQRTSDALYDLKRKRREARDRGDDYTAALLADDAAALENDLQRDNELLITLSAPPLSATSSRAPSYAVQPAAAASQRPAAAQQGDSRPRPPGASPAVFVSPMTEHDTNPGTAERGASPWTAEPVAATAKHPHHDTQPHSLGATEPFADAPQRAPSRGPHDVPANRSGGTASEPAAAAGANGPASSRNALPPRRRPPSASATA